MNNNGCLKSQKIVTDVYNIASEKDSSFGLPKILLSIKFRVLAFDQNLTKNKPPAHSLQGL